MIVHFLAEILDLFKIKEFSKPGSSALRKEQATYGFFRDLLKEMESKYNVGLVYCLCHEACSLSLSESILYFAGRTVILTLNQFLAFFTGAEEIPATGFDFFFTLQFCHYSELPTSATRALSLTLPTQYYDDYEMFREKMLYAIMHHLTMEDLVYVNHVVCKRQAHVSYRQ